MISGCATSQATLADSTLPVLELDVVSRTYALGGVEKKLVSCDTSNFHCLDLEHIGVIAMFKACSAYSHEFAVPGVPGVFRMYAPAPHLSPPAGSFYNSENRRIVYHYNKRDGLYQTDISDSGPSAEEATANKFRVETTNGRMALQCR